MDKVILSATERTEFSKGALSALRNRGNVPGVVYGRHIEKPVAVEFTEKKINPLVFTSETKLVVVQIGEGREYECVIKEVQFDPITDRVIHVDFMGLSKDETVQLEVPVQTVGSAIGVRDGGVLNLNLHKLDIECLPADIPEHIEIDVTNLKVGDSIHVKDLSFNNLTILNSEDAVVVTVSHQRSEVLETPGEIKEPEVIAKGKKEAE